MTTPTPDTTDGELEERREVVELAKGALLNQYSWLSPGERIRLSDAIVTYTAQKVAEARRDELLRADDAIEGDWIEYRDTRDGQLSQLEGKEQR